MDFLGGRKTETKVKLPAPTAEEKALLSQQLKLASSQLDNLSQVGDFTADVFQKMLPELVGQINQFLPQQQQITGDTLDFAGMQVSAQGELLQSELDAIRNGVALTPEQEKLISDSANASIQSGLSDIGAFRDESLRTLAQETAIGRGLRPEDTPILDVGGRVINESTRQASDFISNVRAQEAQQKLQYPLAAGQFQAERTQAQQTFGANTMSFIEQLRQQAFQNRLALTTTAGGIGLDLAKIGPNPSTLAGLQNVRTASATTTGKQSGNFLDILKAGGALAGGIGGLATGVGSLGMAGG